MTSTTQTFTYILFVATILTSATVVIALFFEEPSKVSWIASLAHPFFALIIYKSIVSRGCVNGDRIIGAECDGSPRSGCHFLDCCTHFAVIREFPWISPFQAQRLTWPTVDLSNIWAHIYITIRPLTDLTGFLVFATLRILGVGANTMGTFDQICSCVGRVTCNVIDDTLTTDISTANISIAHIASIGSIQMICLPLPYSKIVSLLSLSILRGCWHTLPRTFWGLIYHDNRISFCFVSLRFF